MSTPLCGFLMWQDVKMASSSPETIDAFVASLVQSLRRWDPRDATQVNNKRSKQAFIDALTEISALPADSLAMEVRRLLVNGGGSTIATEDTRHLDHLVAALDQRDVLLKCKVANAVGSICTSRVAGQQLLDTHGASLLTSLTRMATSKNTWAQADAFFVFGWVVVNGEDAMVQQHLDHFVRIAIRVLQRNIERHQVPEEQDINVRIYCLVFLLNVSQRDVTPLVASLEDVLSVIHMVMLQLLEDAPKIFMMQEVEEQTEKLREHIEFGRLVVTLLSTLVDAAEETSAAMLSLKMFPTVIKFGHALNSEALKALLDGTHDDADEDDHIQTHASSEEVLNDMKQRLDVIKAIVLADAR